MPLFRSHSSAEAALRRTDLERQIGCIAGFFQIFDQQTRKQIAGPRKDASLQQHPTSAESYPFADFVLKEDDSILPNECLDAKVAGGDDRLLADIGVDAPACAVAQLAFVSDDSLSLPGQDEKLHRGRPSNVREELPQANAMVRHGSFNHNREYSEHDISFSPRRGHIGAYAAGGRRFTSKEVDRQAGRFPIDNSEDSRGMPREEERWGFWKPPVSHWPSSNGVTGQQEPPQEIAAEGVKGGWSGKGGRAVERPWAAEDSLEDWKQSLRALVRLREDGETGDLSNRGGCVAPKASPRFVRNDPSASPARASAFDFKDAIRWSQCVSSQTECSRRSLDDRDLPHSIAELRDAIHARSRLLSAASPPPSPRPPSVIARLMGLEDLPKPPIPEPTPFINHRNRKPSGEAKLLQQLLQYSPPTPPSFTHPPLPPSPTSNPLRRVGQGACTVNSDDSPTFTSNYKNPPMDSEVQSMPKNFESMAHNGSINTSSAKLNNSLNHAKLQESTGHTGTTDYRPLRPSALKKNNQQRLPVVVLKQSEEICSPLPRSNHGFHDEIERRLRQLGLQSSEQERKTLKQILEAMQIKGLLRPPDGTKFSNEAKQQPASFPGSAVLVGNGSPARAPSNGVESWPTPMSKNASRSYSNVIRSAKNNSGASIVIMRPVSKSANRVALTGDDRRLGNERSGTPSRCEKITLRKPKNAINPEANTLKESAGSRSKSRSTAVTPQSPVPNRKLSLRIRQSQVHLAKGPARAMPSEQARRSGPDIPSARRQERAVDKASVKPVVMKAGSNVSENHTLVGAKHAQSSNIHAIVTTPDAAKQPNCILGSSASSSDVDVPEVTSINEGRGGTPPRETKGDHSFGVNGDCCSKEVIHEQCSPVSVLDSHLSDDDEESPAPESIRALTDFQEDISSCSPSVGGSRCSLQESEDIEAMQPIAVEINFKATMTDSINESYATDEDSLEATKDTSRVAQDKRGPARANIVDLLHREDVLHNDMACTCSSSCFTKDMVGRADECTDKSRDCEHMIETYANSGNCMHMNATLRSNRDAVYKDDNACARDIVHMNDACASTGDDTHDACGCKGDDTDKVCANNADLCYTEDVLRAAGLVGTRAGWTCAADGWLACGGKMRREVFEELEEQWDAVNAEEEGGHLKAEDRDMGGELYRKSQQASMRRRLVFDCLNEIVEGRLSWLGMPGTCSSSAYGHLSVSMLWGDLQGLEQGPCSAEDSMYAMLEQDLLHDADYSTPFCWRGMPTQLAAVALHLESDIFDALVSEILSQAPL